MSEHFSQGDRFKQAVKAIDRENSDDPVRILRPGEIHQPEKDGKSLKSEGGRKETAEDTRGDVGGACQREVVHSELMTKWVKQLDAEPDEAQLLAARACHLRRFDMPRSQYPIGRAGYLRWRKDQARRHAELAGEILSEAGYEPEIIKRVGDIIQKKNLKKDPQVQTHEDALCLTFLELQYEELKERLTAEARQETKGEQGGKGEVIDGEKKMKDILGKTLKKMSPAGQKIAKSLL